MATEKKVQAYVTLLHFTLLHLTDTSFFTNCFVATWHQASLLAHAEFADFMSLSHFNNSPNNSNFFIIIIVVMVICEW